MKLKEVFFEDHDLSMYNDRFRNILNEFDAYQANIFDQYDTVPENLFDQFKRTRVEFVKLIKLLK